MAVRAICRRIPRRIRPATQEFHMPKGEQRSNREAKKPKKAPPPKVPASGLPKKR
jgi:hypothetical protein